jgi:prevent-host-death family protein
MAAVKASEAKTHFAEYLRAAEAGKAVIITRHGKPVAALVSVAELEQLERLRSVSPADGLASLVGRWDDGHELADQLDEIVASRSMPRPVAALD